MGIHGVNNTHTAAPATITTISLVTAFYWNKVKYAKNASNLNTELSRGSAATYFRCSGYYYSCFVGNLTDFSAVTEFILKTG